MTAEIAVLNRSAVALAADSAVTITTHTGQKIYNTVNKLFSLSKYEPIGVMVNGGADLMGVPWELVIKLYRHDIGAREFESIRSAADHLLQWVRDNYTLFTPTMREQFVEATVASFLATIVRHRIDETVQERLNHGEVHQAELPGIAETVVEATATELADRPECGWATPHQAASIIASGSDPFERLVTEVFENLPLTDAARHHLQAICRLILHKDVFTGTGTGLVVAGYGRDEAFPALAHFEIDGLVGAEAKAVERSSYRIGEDGAASISPFAQREMVDTFISGIAPDYEEALDGFLGAFFAELPARVGDEIGDAVARADVERVIGEVGAAAHEHFATQIREYTQRRFVDPIVSAVEVLPKEELAEMAEALVNLTSFKRRVSLGEVETVGGPIDVAVISKGDGFVWIKRKHYFKPELNPQFFANYYR